jgi:hypothetical protein
MGTRRAGTRYNTRGIDDEGAVANFVETELLYTDSSSLLSFLQVRGSVPTFWDQPGIQVVGHRIQVTRSNEAAFPAFKRHMSELSDRYGEITAVSLVSQEGGSESTLSTEYIALFQRIGLPESLINYDFHAKCRGGNYAPLRDLVAYLEDKMLSMGCFLVDISNGQVILVQRGAFRVNCVDCLDR